MKKRNGFVSNSSSSSFILGFTDLNLIGSELSDVKDKECYDQIFSDCMHEEKLNFEKILALYEEELNESWFEYNFLYDYIRKNKYSYSNTEKIKYSEEYRKEFKEAYKKKVNEFIEKCKDKNIFVRLEYDDDGFDAKARLKSITYGINSCLAAFSYH